MIHLNGIQKSALLLLSLDLEESVQVLKFFTELEISVFMETIVSFDANIIQFSDVVLHDFYVILKKNQIFNFDMKSHISGIVEKSIGKRKSNKLLKNSFMKSVFLHNISRLELLGSKNIFFLIQNENLNIISTLLMYINYNISAQILALFEKKKRSDILIRIMYCVDLQETVFIELNKIVHCILLDYQKSSLEECRIDKIISILLFFKKNNIIQWIKKINTSYSYILNNRIIKYFKFENIIDLTDSSIKFIINNIDINQLCIVLTHEDNIVKKKFINNMSINNLKYFKDTSFVNSQVSLEKIYLKRNLLLTKIKQYIRDGKVFIE
ncbi:FliG C-terminal domain-containing protein [Buchnera aphidicola]|uniref:Flagellar motor switch protein FliG n=1 Tax=Buchnera aphidicola (Cinara strobi) TaxID=1921549 RepID=A0A3B1DKL2_9GAMM|nr:FliG C-terminal domain-containing protein [Buchnera aphidicola]VAX76261.1 Flagellar motor switch protein FliG [Buchnera aphidicola (Cinara strobi)]